MTMHSRSRRAFWGDARFLIGLALVALSIGGVWLVVSTAGATTPMLQATRTIVEGEPLASGDFQVVEVNLAGLTGDYLGPQDLRPGDVAARTVTEGELIPATAAADPAQTRTTTIVVESGTGIPKEVVAGTVVELWSAPPLDDGRTFESPRILVTDVIVSAVIDSEAMLASDGTSVEVVIDRADVADVLAAITGGSVLSIVPVGAAQ
nr:hypothetical protein [uncultured Microbacterium sp.]